MFRDVAQKALGRTVIKRNGEEIDLAKPWRRVTMRELILERFGPRLHGVHARAARGGARRADGPERDLGGGRRRHLLARKSRRTINQPTHVFDFPLEPFPITKRHAVHPELAEHFDAVIGGIELVSGDTELNDPVDQWQRFVEQRKRRMIDDADVPHPNDEEYARAIEYGYSPTAGGGMGVDRLVMILTERDTLREVIPFPIVRDLVTASKLDLDPGVVAACRQAARADRRAGAERIAGHTTVSVERSVTRLLGVDGADELEAPLPNVLVDHVQDGGGLGRGVAYWLGNAMLQTGRSPQQIAEAVSARRARPVRARRSRPRIRGRDPRARERGVRRAPARDPRALRGAPGDARAPRRERARRCATCSPRPATCTRTSCTRRLSRRPAATSWR